VWGTNLFSAWPPPHSAADPGPLPLRRRHYRRLRAPSFFFSELRLGMRRGRDEGRKETEERLGLSKGSRWASRG
jgi:hypothetical protein